MRLGFWHFPPGLGRAIESEDGDRGDEYQVSGLPAPAITSGPKAGKCGEAGVCSVY